MEEDPAREFSFSLVDHKVVRVCSEAEAAAAEAAAAAAAADPAGEFSFTLVDHKVVRVCSEAEAEAVEAAEAAGGAAAEAAAEAGEAVVAGKKAAARPQADARPQAPDLMWHVERYGVPEARAEFGVDGAGVRVAVIDTGAHCAHPRLGGRVTAHDYTGLGLGGGDDNGHGSHVCGIVHAVAPGAEIHSFRVFEPQNRAVESNIMRALEDILSEKHGRFDVINMSLGAEEPRQSMRMALLDLNSRGSIICCAAGNAKDHCSVDAPRFGTVNWPAHFNSTIAVGSLDRDRRRSPFSSTGPMITVMAPGENVWSCWKDDTLACLSGTSMATPFVAGVMCLMLQACKNRAQPRPNMGELLHCMAASCSDLEAPGFDFFTGYGCIHPPGLIARVLSRAPRYD